MFLDAEHFLGDIALVIMVAAATLILLLPPIWGRFFNKDRDGASANRLSPINAEIRRQAKKAGCYHEDRFQLH